MTETFRNIILLIIFFSTQSLYCRNMGNDYWDIIKQVNERQTDYEKINFIEKLSDEQINTKSNSDENLLHGVIANSSTIVLNALIKRGLDINNVNSFNGRNLLFKTEDSYIIKFLLDNGVEIDHQDNDGWTPLIYHLHSDDLIDLLLGSGADTQLKTKSEHTFLQEVIINVHDSKIEAKLIISKSHSTNFSDLDPNGLSLIHISILYQKPRALDYLLKNTRNINSVTKNEYNFSKGGNKLLLLKNSTPTDLCNILVDWVDKDASDNIGGEWVYEQKIEIYTCSLILKENLSYMEAKMKAEQMFDNK